MSISGNIPNMKSINMSFFVELLNASIWLQNIVKIPIKCCLNPFAKRIWQELSPVIGRLQADYIKYCFGHCCKLRFMVISVPKWVLDEMSHCCGGVWHFVNYQSLHVTSSLFNFVFSLTCVYSCKSTCYILSKTCSYSF